MEHHLVLRVVSRILIPPTLMYGLYVQFHGDFGPGGGFQAGVIFAVAFILYGIVFDLKALRTVVSVRFVIRLAALGVLIFSGVGVYTILNGKNYLDYHALSPDPVAAQHLGILLVELGVGIAVFAVMLAVFIAFASRSPHIRDTDW